MNNEAVIRLVFFAGIFALIAIWERMSPRRSMTTSKKVRWISNLGITCLNPLVVQLLFPILAVGMAMFNHGNIRIRPGLDRILRDFVVTPDMHRVHHSVIIPETNSNYLSKFYSRPNEGLTKK